MPVFGPVPSRRLGRSLGINNIKEVHCTQSCIYCQLGLHKKVHTDRTEFYSPEHLLNETKSKMTSLTENGESVDYITFVADGEPTLDKNLSKIIVLLKSLGKKIAVISNGTLITDENVFKTLLKANWVSFKVDSVIDNIRKNINKPMGNLYLDEILKGLAEFRLAYTGYMTTETMLVKGVNDMDENLEAVSHFLQFLKPDKAYISIPTRPPAHDWVEAPDEETISKWHKVFEERGVPVELLICSEGMEFSIGDDFEKDLLDITSVHPIRESALDELLKRRNKSWDIVEKLIEKDQIKKVSYGDDTFYIKKLDIPS